MKNKKLTYFLLAAVILVWGFAFYQIAGGLFGSETQTSVSAKPVSFIVKTDDTAFSIKASYRDPFLGHLSYQKKSPEFKPKKVVKEIIREEPLKQTAEPVVDISFIQYIGMIKNQQSGKLVAFMRIRNKEYFMAENDSAQSVIFNQSFKDSVQITYSGKKYFIRKN